MLSKREIEQAIGELETAASTYQNCEKLASLYVVYDHMYGKVKSEFQAETEVVDHGMSDFLQMIRGMKAEAAWMIMDELMSAVQVTNPRLYESVMRKIAE